MNSWIIDIFRFSYKKKNLDNNNIKYFFIKNC